MFRWGSSQNFSKLPRIVVDVGYRHGFAAPIFGDVPRRSTSLADALGVSTDYLIEGDVQDAAKADFKDRELLRMFQEIENFDAKDKETVKALLDAFIKKKRFVELAVGS